MGWWRQGFLQNTVSHPFFQNRSDDNHSKPHIPWNKLDDSVMYPGTFLCLSSVWTMKVSIPVKYRTLTWYCACYHWKKGAKEGSPTQSQRRHLWNSLPLVNACTYFHFLCHHQDQTPACNTRWGNNYPIILPFKIFLFCCSSPQLDCCFQEIQVRSVHFNSCYLSVASQLHFSRTKQETKSNQNPNPHLLNPYCGSQGPLWSGAWPWPPGMPASSVWVAAAATSLLALFHP